MCQKRNGLTTNGKNPSKSMLLKINKLDYEKWPDSGQEKGGKNEGMFHDVVENKWRKYVRNQAFHDVDEKKEG